MPWTESAQRPAAIVVPLLCALYYLRKRLVEAAVAKKQQGASKGLGGRGTPSADLTDRSAS